MHPLIRRQVLTQRTHDRFWHKPFRWGSCDCAKVAAWHARQFGWKVPSPGRYASEAGARARLDALGCADIHALVDQVGLAPIVPASAIEGDFLGSAGADGGLGALGIVLGGGKMLSFHEDSPGMEVVAVNLGGIMRAWSIWKAG